MLGRAVSRPSSAAGHHNGVMTEAPGSAYPTQWEADVLLRDGHPVHLRPITPLDGDALRLFHDSLSGRTVYFRFFSAKPRLTDKDVHYFTEVDHHDRVALIALDAGLMIGVGRFDALGDGTAEVAFVIRDDVQGLGLGSVLLEHLAAAARECGIHKFVAEVLPENHRMLATFREAGFEVHQHREEDVLAVSFDIEPTATSMAVMEAREHRAEARSVERLLHPARIAIVGASRAPGGLGHAVLRHLVDGGYRGDLVAVHPEVDEIAGVRCVRSLTDVEETIDLAIVVVRAPRVAAVIEDAASAGVHGLVVVSGGFGDSGPDGLALQADLVSLVHRTGMRLVGPNALGVINTDPDVLMNASLVTQMPPSGRVGFFSQSGALGGSILERFGHRGLGLSTFVSAGNRADISGNDLLQYWEEDARTDLVMLYLETIGNARKFARIVHRLAAKKPVVMVRTGGAGQRHPLGHAVRSTELSQRAVDGILGDCGLVVVESIDHLIDVARLAGSQPLPTSTRVAIVGNSDALAVMAVNGCERTILEPAGEPVTLARQESPEAYEAAITAALADPKVGSVLAIYVPPIEASSDADIRAMLRHCARPKEDASLAKPVIAVMLGTHASQPADDVPAFRDVEDALQALSAVTRYALWRDAPDRRAVTELPVPPESDPDQLAPGVVSGHTANALLISLGIEMGHAPVQPELGVRIQLLDDPLFGAVICVGVDDPVAQILDDRSYRLAPVSIHGARAMLDELASLEVVAPEHIDANGASSREAIAELVQQVSSLTLVNPQVVEVDARHVQAGIGAQDRLAARSVSVTVAAAPVLTEPAARRI